MLKGFYWAFIKLFRIHKIKLFFGHKGVVFKRLTRFQKPRKNSLECLNIFIFIYLPILPIFLLCPIPHLYFISFLFRTKIKFHKSLTINLLTTVRNPLIKVSRVSNWIIYQSISNSFYRRRDHSAVFCLEATATTAFWRIWKGYSMRLKTSSKILTESSGLQQVEDRSLFWPGGHHKPLESFRFLINDQSRVIQDVMQIRRNIQKPGF